MGSNLGEGKVVVDWRSVIVAAVAVQQACMRVDLDHLWDYPLPEVRASEEEIAHTEERLGFRLPEQYRSFLSYANGWKHFSQNISLFGTHELLEGHLHDDAQMLLKVLIDEPVSSEEYDFSLFFPIAVSTTQIDLFVLGKIGSPWEGEAIWTAGYTVGEYRTFIDCFQAMVAYNKRDAEAFAKEHRLEGEPRFEIPVFDDDGRGGK